MQFPAFSHVLSQFSLPRHGSFGWLFEPSGGAGERRSNFDVRRPSLPILYLSNAEAICQQGQIL